ncbi:hypothetical protein llap_11193 [Limosa lapponica baueri]|uniref:Uncharacterized protein n=1 Tax=Limosa lapponica baueri TaxID=1758121 RepID=A0A2I0TXF2_LIMLA|nr:hypothetical protein llap_11193 [Limosa lapponica baueri]
MRISNELTGAETGKSMGLRFKSGIKMFALEKLLQHDRRCNANQSVVSELRGSHICCSGRKILPDTLDLQVLEILYNGQNGTFLNGNWETKGNFSEESKYLEGFCGQIERKMFAGRKGAQVSCEGKENKHSVTDINPVCAAEEDCCEHGWRRTCVQESGFSNIMEDVLKNGFEQDT